MEKRVPTKTMCEAVGFMVPRFARAVLRSGSSGSGLTWLWPLVALATLGLFGLWPHMALASHGSGDTDHVRVMQRVAGPEP